MMVPRIKIELTRRRGRRTSVLAGAAFSSAAAMYFFDPSSGARRRSILHGRVVRLFHEQTGLWSKAARDIQHRARGFKAALGHRVRRERVLDVTLVERVRAELGRVTSHPAAITVGADEGTITLSGPVLAQERNGLIDRVRHVRGVRGVRDSLDVHQSAESVPSLQGDARTPHPYRRMEIAQESWTPSLRIGAILAGLFLGGLGATGVRKRRGWIEVVLLGSGATLFLRGVTDLPIARMIGAGAGRRAIDLHKTISVAAPVDEAFALFANFERIPRFMEHVREVRVDGEGRSRWTVTGPARIPVTFDIEITKLEPNRLLMWKTVEGSAIEHAGTVHFESQPNGTTRVDVQMSYNPMVGALGHIVARLFRVDPKRALDEDLVRFKSLLEDGKTRAHEQAVLREDVLQSAPQSSASSGSPGQ